MQCSKKRISTFYIAPYKSHNVHYLCLHRLSHEGEVISVSSLQLTISCIFTSESSKRGHNIGIEARNLYETLDTRTQKPGGYKLYKTERVLWWDFNTF